MRITTLTTAGRTASVSIKLLEHSFLKVCTDARSPPSNNDARTSTMNTAGVIPVEGIIESNKLSISEAPFRKLIDHKVIFVIGSVF